MLFFILFIGLSGAHHLLPSHVNPLRCPYSVKFNEEGESLIKLCQSNPDDPIRFAADSSISLRLRSNGLASLQILGNAALLIMRDSQLYFYSEGKRGIPILPTDSLILMVPGMAQMTAVKALEALIIPNVHDRFQLMVALSRNRIPYLIFEPPAPPVKHVSEEVILARIAVTLLIISMILAFLNNLALN